MTFRVERDIPIPPFKRKGNRHSGDPKYPWPLMEIGDSFLVEAEGRDAAVLAQLKVASSATWFAKKHGKKFLSRTCENGVRWWRVK